MLKIVKLDVKKIFFAFHIFLAISAFSINNFLNMLLLLLKQYKMNLKYFLVFSALTKLNIRSRFPNNDDSYTGFKFK